MRYATVTIQLEAGVLQPVDDAVRSADGLQRTGIRQITLLSDGTCVTLYGLRGDIQSAESLLERQGDVLSYDISGQREGLAYIHFEPTETVEALLRLVQDHEFVLQTPIEPLDCGGLRVTIVGDDDALRRAVEAMPDSLALSLESTGDYRPDSADLYATLTPRQQEILDVATEMGYYEVPREVTHDDIAAELGISGETVGEHLRKVERKVLNAVSK